MLFSVVADAMFHDPISALKVLRLIELNIAEKSLTPETFQFAIGVLAESTHVAPVGSPELTQASIAVSSVVRVYCTGTARAPRARLNHTTNAIAIARRRAREPSTNSRAFVRPVVRLGAFALVPSPSFAVRLRSSIALRRRAILRHSRATTMWRRADDASEDAICRSGAVIRSGGHDVGPSLRGESVTPRVGDARSRERSRGHSFRMT